MLEILDEQEFNEFSRNFNNSLFFQSSYWGKLKETTGWKYYLVGYKENELKAASLLLAKKIPIINRYIFYSPRGFLIDYNDFNLLKKYTEEIKKFVKKNKGIFFKINPLISYQDRDTNGNIIEKGINNQKIVDNLKKLGYSHVGFTQTYGKDLEPRWISVLDIENKTYDEVFKNFNATKKNLIRNADNSGLKLVEIKKDRMQEFKDLMLSTSKRRGFIDRSITYYNNMFDIFKKDDYIKIILVEMNFKENKKIEEEKLNKVNGKIKHEKEKYKIKENVIKELENQKKSHEKKIEKMQKYIDENAENIVVAGGLFMTFGPQVVSLFGASYKEYMSFNGQYFLNNEMIKYAIKNNYKKYNFYGITGDFSKDSPMYGLFDFKRSFGSNVEELIGEFTYITDKFYNNVYKLMYKAYVILKKVKK